MSAGLPSLPRSARIVEVGPRDGLQNEPGVVPTDDKVAFIAALAAAGLPVIEASSFVRADRIPQLGDAEEVFKGLATRLGDGKTGVRGHSRLLALVPNLKGLERAVSSGCKAIAVFTAASETFNRKNINRGIAESLREIEEVLKQARAGGLWTRGYVSTAFGCPYEGEVKAASAAGVVQALLDLGCEEVSIGDTIGVATPKDVERILAEVLARAPAGRLALHLHDTRGTALANVYAGLLLGISTFDSSAGGLGGCPYAPGASGNLATEDLVYLLDGLGIETGVDLEGVRKAARRIGELLGRPLPSRAHQAPAWPRRG